MSSIYTPFTYLLYQPTNHQTTPITVHLAHIIAEYRSIDDL